MVLQKCTKCNKNITKKAPGLECSRCHVVVHADAVCAKLSNKQLNTLRNLSSIEWSCEECMKNTSHRSSFLIPNEEDEENESTECSPGNFQPLDTDKLIRDISREIKKTFREELRNLESSMEFVSDQIANMEQSIKNQDNKIKDLLNKNQDLQNKNKNQELRIAVLEEGMKAFEQKSLSTSLEIAGLSETAPKDMGRILETVASKLEVSVSDIQSSRRLPGSQDRPGPLLIEMKTKVSQMQWIDAGKTKCLTLGVLFPDIPKEKVDNRIYIREALTKHLKTLLYSAKVNLGKTYQFVWCKDGKVCARQNNNSKIYYIRSIQDITKLQKDVQGTVSM